MYFIMLVSNLLNMRLAWEPLKLLIVQSPSVVQLQHCRMLRKCFFYSRVFLFLHINSRTIIKLSNYLHRETKNLHLIHEDLD